MPITAERPPPAAGLGFVFSGSFFSSFHLSYPEIELDL
jgi:hypothetical protein